MNENLDPELVKISFDYHEARKNIPRLGSDDFWAVEVSPDDRREFQELLARIDNKARDGDQSATKPQTD